VLVDTHCHLHLLDAPADQVVAEALAQGVGHLVDVGVDLASSRQAVANAARLPQVSASAGIHPHDADTLDGAALDELRRLLAGDGVVGVGETGLDYYRTYTPPEQQRQGAGRATLEAAMAYHRAQGTSIFYLGATEAGKPLYERTGFRTLEETPIWVAGHSAQFPGH
jgi:Tat protein secretion system quality control protein TatD with DNase activity